MTKIVSDAVASARLAKPLNSGVFVMRPPGSVRTGSFLNQHVEAIPRMFVTIFEHYCTLSYVEDANHLGKPHPNLVK
jgi:hypothetical protein